MGGIGDDGENNDKDRDGSRIQGEEFFHMVSNKEINEGCWGSKSGDMKIGDPRDI